ncbi:MAG: hypothetical protein H0T21_01205 [Gemmatimonadaceae bacterium]|nr:hypothetical protein [Gemmatimonadaceae bacterium]
MGPAFPTFELLTLTATRLREEGFREEASRIEGLLQGFSPVDVETLHSAAYAYVTGADKREEKMPSSARAMRLSAKKLESLRDRLIQLLPAGERRAYD